MPRGPARVAKARPKEVFESFFKRLELVVRNFIPARTTLVRSAFTSPAELSLSNAKYMQALIYHSHQRQHIDRFVGERNGRLSYPNLPALYIFWVSVRARVLRARGLVERPTQLEKAHEIVPDFFV